MNAHFHRMHAKLRDQCMNENIRPFKKRSFFSNCILRATGITYSVENGYPPTNCLDHMQYDGPLDLFFSVTFLNISKVKTHFNDDFLDWL